MTALRRIVRYYPRAALGDGGMTRAVRRWADSVAALGPEVDIVFDRGEPPAERGPARWIPLPHRGRTPVRVPIGLGRVLRGADLLVIHSGWTAHGAFAARQARSLGIPYLLEPRGAYDPHIVRRHDPLRRLFWAAAEQSVVRGAAAIQVFFEPERSHLDAIGYRGPLVVVTNGVDSPAQPPWTGGGGYLLFLGRFDPQHKGLDLLVRAVARLSPTDRPVVRLCGPDRRGGKGHIARLVSELAVGRWVTIEPAVYGEPKRALLTAADGFVYPSRWDACPNAVLEAVSLGVPTLCTPYPLGIDLAGRGGALLAEADPEGLAAGISGLGERRHAADVGAAGAATVRAGFAWTGVAERWLSQVRTILDRPDAAEATGRPSLENTTPDAPPR
jgi:glycosyltransferase involved in cell wall biosynthesis